MGEEVDENNQSIEGVSFVCCPNKERIRIMKASLGELCRNDSLDRTPWTEIPKKPCKLILPDNNDSESEDQASMSQVQISSEDDCYGRLFGWEHMRYLLLPLGDYLKKDFQLGPAAVAWGTTTDGSVFEFKIKEGRCFIFHIFSVKGTYFRN
uniref:Uncharacterized protein n=1 Tax=Rhizophagus irregularis (strain DAOM 181602 / DAOM 197198 / MUCL 43194) TaxID=747089 RepID=U9TQW9_RHIID